LSLDTPYEVEFRALRADGEVIWLYSNANRPAREWRRHADDRRVD
jgi:hypothetical protein